MNLGEHPAMITAILPLNLEHRRAQVAAGEVKAFPQVHGRRPVAHAEKEEIHVSRMCGS